jgi:hypothetical protein
MSVGQQTHGMQTRGGQVPGTLCFETTRSKARATVLSISRVGKELRDCSSPSLATSAIMSQILFRTDTTASCSYPSNNAVLTCCCVVAELPLQMVFVLSSLLKVLKATRRNNTAEKDRTYRQPAQGGHHTVSVSATRVCAAS